MSRGCSKEWSRLRMPKGIKQAKEAQNSLRTSSVVVLGYTNWVEGKMRGRPKGGLVSTNQNATWRRQWGDVTEVSANPQRRQGLDWRRKSPCPNKTQLREKVRYKERRLSNLSTPQEVKNEWQNGQQRPNKPLAMANTWTVDKPWTHMEVKHA